MAWTATAATEEADWEYCEASKGSDGTTTNKIDRGAELMLLAQPKLYSLWGLTQRGHFGPDQLVVDCIVSSSGLEASFRTRDECDPPMEAIS